MIKDKKYLFKLNYLFDKYKNIRKNNKINVKNNNFLNYENIHWKYKALDNIKINKFVFPKKKIISIEDCNKYSIKLDAYRIIFINGKLNIKFSNIDICKDLKIVSLNKDNNNLIFTKNYKKKSFNKLNNKLISEIVYFKLKENKTLKKPLYLLHINYGKNNSYKINSINSFKYIDIKNNSNLNIIEHFISMDSNNYCICNKNICNLYKNSKLNYIKLISKNYKNYYFLHDDFLNNGSNKLNIKIFDLGSKLSKQKINVKFNKKNSYLNIDSLLLPLNNNLHELKTNIKHNVKNCNSNQVHKIISANNSLGIFTGIIKIKKKSKKTYANLLNNNLLLSKNSEIKSTPQLEIYNNNVICNHGSTISSFNSNQIFYLQTRGLEEKYAKKIIIYSFAISILKNIKCKHFKKIIKKNINKILKEINI